MTVGMMDDTPRVVIQLSTPLPTAIRTLATTASAMAATGLRYWRLGSYGFALLMALSGCVTTHKAPPEQAVPPAAELVPVNAAWRMQAKAAVTTANGVETVSVSWHRASSSRDTLVISGPLGLGARTLIREGSELWWLERGRRVPVGDLVLDRQHLALIASLPLPQLAPHLIGHGLTHSRYEIWHFNVMSWQSLSGYKVPRKLHVKSPELSLYMVILSLEVESAS